MLKKKLNENQLYGLFPCDSEGIDPFIELALDLGLSSNPPQDRLTDEQDPDLWESINNAWMILQSLSRDQLDLKLTDPDFLKKMRELINKKALRSSKSS